MSDVRQGPRLVYLGHSTVVLDMDGVRVLTDPLLRDRLAHLRRHTALPDPDVYARPDAVLISHLHLDHLDFPSLRLLGYDTRVVVPAGGGQLVERRGFRVVEEMREGDVIAVGDVRIVATPAHHYGFRPPVGPLAPSLGFVVSGSRSVYFAGDTDLFPGMSDIGSDLDVGLIPVWGWGRHLGPGHMDPYRAAEAAALLRPRLAVPIHWGTFASPATLRRNPAFLSDPPRLFAGWALERAPGVSVRIIEPGDSLTLV